jgi:hypothetical protein
LTTCTVLEGGGGGGLRGSCDVWHSKGKCVVQYVFGVLECVGHSFAYVAHFVYLRDVWIRTQRAAVPSMRATNLATHLALNS